MATVASLRLRRCVAIVARSGRLPTSAPAAFLASAEAGCIIDQSIAVDGGQVLPESPDAVTR